MIINIIENGNIYDGNRKTRDENKSGELNE